MDSYLAILQREHAIMIISSSGELLTPPPLLSAHWSVFAREVLERVWLICSNDDKSALTLLYEYFDDAYMYVSQLWRDWITCNTPPYAQIREYVFLELERDLYRQSVLKPIAEHFLNLELDNACDQQWQYEISACMHRSMLSLLS